MNELLKEQYRTSILNLLQLPVEVVRSGKIKVSYVSGTKLSVSLEGYVSNLGEVLWELIGKVEDSPHRPELRYKYIFAAPASEADLKLVNKMFDRIPKPESRFDAVVAAGDIAPLPSKF